MQLRGGRGESVVGPDSDVGQVGGKDGVGVVRGDVTAYLNEGRTASGRRCCSG